MGSSWEASTALRLTRPQNSRPFFDKAGAESKARRKEFAGASAARCKILQAPGEKKGVLPKALSSSEGCRGSDRAALRPEEVLQPGPGPSVWSRQLKCGKALQARCTSQLWSPRWSWQADSRNHSAAGVGGTLSVDACNRGDCLGSGFRHICHCLDSLRRALQTAELHDDRCCAMISKAQAACLRAAVGSKLIPKYPLAK